MVGNQLSLRDVILNVIPGIMLIVIFIFFYYSITGNIIKLTNNEIIDTLLILMIAYITGHLSSFNFKRTLRYKLGKQISKSTKVIFTILYGKSNCLDYRKDYLESDNWKSRIKLLFPNTNTDSIDSKEMFYTIVKYNENYASPNGLFDLERNVINFNLGQKLTSVFTISIILNIITIVLLALKKADFEKITIHLFLSVVALILSRMSFKLMQSRFDSWCKDHCRLFFVLTSNIQNSEK